MNAGVASLKGYYYWIAGIVFVLDQVTKKIVERNMELHESISIIGDFFRLTSHRNPGAAFGILQEQRTFFIIITIVVLAAIIWYITLIRKSGKTMMLVALGLVLGGAVGNFVDRLLYGKVVDFLDFHLGFYDFPIFNIADMGIVCGGALILLDAFRDARNEKKESSQGNGDKDEYDAEPNADGSKHGG